ncbi:hypothetical protein O6H91_09G124800 [Diphasiastrum complanatum]|uniref:Uncharacterized protein n=1 Tax=Diphasiastrum complanatum TaxID=34168 RepID=A0ACC2CU27_DIPCM|nr:hypothetical protein O6H91_09G124800 [Diphasiastrum complanatum]
MSSGRNDPERVTAPIHSSSGAGTRSIQGHEARRHVHSKMMYVLEAGRHVHSNMMFLDKAPIVTDSTRTGESNTTSSWKLCTVHQVEEFKCLLRILPIWVTDDDPPSQIVQTSYTMDGRAKCLPCGPYAA